MKTEESENPIPVTCKNENNPKKRKEKEYSPEKQNKTKQTNKQANNQETLTSVTFALHEETLTTQNTITKIFLSFAT